MLAALIRPIEVHEITVEGHDLAEMREKLIAQTPPGFELVSAPVTMKTGAPRTMVGRFERRDGVEEIEADDMAALEAKVPDGYRMLSVRRV